MDKNGWHLKSNWMNDCEITNAEEIKWRETCQLTSKCIKITKLKKFKFKFLHRRISTNDLCLKLVKDVLSSPSTTKSLKNYLN